MAVDYFHRLVVTGRADRIRDFKNRIYREYPRTVAGDTWTEIVPFSFEALYKIAPRARTVEAEVPFDPYELSAWPARRSGRRHALVRYQFQSRNLEMRPFIRALARALPDLTFTLVTLCLDDSSIASYRFEAGRQRTWTLPQRVRDAHWERARRKFKLSGDDVYEDDDAELWAEDAMMAEALHHWEDRARGRSRPRRYQWWNCPPLRRIEDERVLALVELDGALAPERTKRSRTRKAGAAPVHHRRTRQAGKKR